MERLNDFIAGKLLKVKAVKLQPQNPFTWATGWHSPIYCDNRKLLSYPQIRNVITLEMARVVAEKYPEAEVIAGVATNAIAIGVLVAEALGLPFIYVHPTPKDHGFENMIEGDLRPRQNVVVIEDQVSVGNNSMKVVEAIRKDGCKVMGIVSIFDYELQDTIKKFKKVDIELTSLSSFDAILRHASATHYINDSDIQILQAWHKEPAKWQK
ncbi:MAG: orotate phosphoribosyltransferase [Paludibacter sp.]|nr:orotate phosphoribosyltransferase [Bacteroidales bacterium]MCM1069370.1 orotate phosphoribosyltransferase [Prevotella sp.]MCM1353890.1 orotate phosphoribosyltransferase [Bacteroides sp.]MCM1442860.1 orotate phosphoribosyltransferase [Muribaculum sp.]MCM1481905.1 orotate phosphoribosyltransferase [Paludibacter sp.]